MSTNRLLEIAEELGCTVEVAGRYTGVEEGYLTSEPIDGYRITTPGWTEGDDPLSDGNSNGRRMLIEVSHDDGETWEPYDDLPLANVRFTPAERVARETLDAERRRTSPPERNDRDE